MALKDALPVIDDRRYADIVAELRTRIARYTPEWTPVWTDVNDSDPGITLVQLFAWLSEMLLYRMGQVPALAYVKFLDLLGIELRARQSAFAEITFAVAEAHDRPVVEVKARTQVSGEAPEGGPPVVFETERALRALAARLELVLSFDGYAHHDVTEANQRTLAGYEPFGPLAAAGAALLLGFRYPAAYAGDRMRFAAGELELAVTVARESGSAAVLSCAQPASRAYPSAGWRWECWAGSEWKPVEQVRDDTLAFTRSGHVWLKLPAEGLMQPGTVDGRLAFWLRVRLETPAYEQVPLLRTLRVNTAVARQAETLREEVLGGSTGRRDQVLTLANTPVIPGSLQLVIDEGSGFEPWSQVADLSGSGPDDTHYLLDPASGALRFGDGVHGRIPVAHVDNPRGNVVAREYRFGGGTRGNLPAGALKTLLGAVAGLDASGVANLFPATGGREEETLDEAKRRAPQAIRSRCRAVTASDYEHLAKEAANIRRAKALPLFHPGFPDVKVPGVVSVIVVPDSDADMPLPSPGTLRSVCAYLEDRRTLCAELFVVAPSYQQVRIEGEVVVADDADPGEVKAGIEDALNTYFHVLHGGDDGLGWPFGGTIRFSRVYQRVFTVRGVASVGTLTTYLDGEPAEACRDVELSPNALLVSAGHRIDAHHDLGAQEPA